MKELVLDCLGEACPVPILKSEKAIEELEVGDLLIVQIDYFHIIFSMGFSEDFSHFFR